MTASPTRPSHLFVLAASPPLCFLFGEGGNSSYFFASVQATLSTEEALSPELQGLLYMADTGQNWFERKKYQHSRQRPSRSLHIHTL